MKKTLAKDLTTPRANAHNAIDDQANAQHQGHLVRGPAQHLVYVLKLEEAHSFLREHKEETKNDPLREETSIHYPLLLAEVGITAPTAWDVATLIVANNLKFRTRAAKIEAIRLAAKQKIASAPHEAAISQVINEVKWPTPS